LLPAGNDFRKEVLFVMTTKVVSSLCRMCITTCGLIAEVEDGKAVRIRANEKHLYKTLCPKAEGLLELTYSKERLTSPLRKVNNQWKVMSWDEAFDFISKHLNNIRDKYGPNALAFHLGNPFVGTHTEKVVRRFADLYGTPNYTSGSSFCYYARTMGHSLTFNHGGVTALPSFKGTHCMIVWGTNPDESSHLQKGAIRIFRERGAKLIVIDPRLIPLAKEADLYAQIRPGTDCVLALSMINVIVQEKLYDKEFVENWTVGFERLAEHVKQYPPELAERITWIPAATIREIARIYANSKPALITSGISPDHSINGIQTNRAIAILIAITNNVEKVGGNTWPARIKFTNLRVKERAAPDEEGVGREYPIFTKFTGGEKTAMGLLDTMLTEKPYPVKALILEGSNPMLIFPDTSTVEKALKKLELLVVIDLFMTDTAKLADVVLPATGSLECKWLKDYRDTGASSVAMAERAIEPIGDCKPDWEIWAELGRRMGYEEYFPWKDADELFAHLLEPSGFSLDQLKQNPGGIRIKTEPQRYLKEGFNTPSGKVELYSETLERHGYDPLPSYKEPPESLVSTPNLAGKYPLIMITGCRSRFYTHSQFRNLSTLRTRDPEPFVEINRETAKGLAISDGDMVAVESPRGGIRLKARVTDDIHPKVVCVPHGWSEANVNVLTESQVRDPISAYPPFRTGLCKVART
jgi:anaerobic selenocysteine-containing dehydrogenase